MTVDEAFSAMKNTYTQEVEFQIPITKGRELSDVGKFLKGQMVGRTFDVQVPITISPQSGQVLSPEKGNPTTLKGQVVQSTLRVQFQSGRTGKGTKYGFEVI